MALLGQNDQQILSLVIQARDEASATIAGVGHAMERVAHIATTAFVWYGLSNVVGQVEDVSAAFITANSSLEQFGKSLQVLYGNAAEATQASNFLTQFAITTPDTLENIRAAGLEMVAIGQDITQVMPAIGNAAAAMGTTTTLASHALARAFQNDFEIMRQELHISQQDLVPFGLQMDKSGHVLQSTLIPAFEKFVQARFGDAMSQQMKTGAGAWSNVEDAFQHAAQVIGQPLFASLTKDMNGFLDFLNTHKADVAAFSDAMGHGLAQGVEGAIHAVQSLASIIPPTVGILRGMWSEIQGPAAAFSAGMGRILAGIGNYLQKQVLPAVYEGIGLMTLWWRTHGQDVTRFLGDIMANFQKFGTYLVSNMGSALLTMRGIVEVGWGAIQGAWAIGQSVVEADATKHSSALLAAYRTVMFGFDDIFEGMEIAIARFLDQGLAPAIDQFHDWANKALQPFEEWAANVGGVFVTLWYNLQNVTANMMDGILRQLNTLQSKIPAGIPGLGALHAEALPSNQRFMPLPHPDVAGDVTQAMAGIRQFTGADQSGYITQASQVNADADIRRIRQFFRNQREQTLQDLARTFGDQQSLAELLQMRGVQGPSALATARSRMTQTGKDQLDALIKKFEADAASGLGLAKVTGGGLGAMPGADGLPVLHLAGLPGLPAAGEGAKTAHDQQALTLAMLASRAYQRPDEAGYGATIASFGMVQRDHLAEMVTLLRQELAASQRREHHDEEIIATLQAQLREQRTGTQAATATAGFTGQMARQLTGAPQPYRDPRAKLGAVHP
jgi:hypothetical protein